VAALTEGVLKTMFFAKVKTLTVVLLGVTVLGLGTGTLYYAADPNQKGPLPAARDKADPGRDGRKPLTDGRPQQAQQAVAEQERAFDRAQQLEQTRREALEREQALRAELELAKKEAAAQRDRAQAALQAAEAERQQAEAQLQAARARLELERGRLAETEARQQGQGADTVGRRGNALRETALNGLKASMDKLRADYLIRRDQLQVRLKKLEAEREKIHAELQELEARAQRDMDTLRQKQAEMARQQEIRPDQRKAPQQVGGDKLDRILEKLEQLERRLERLEWRGH
jgi:hypothetical protein